MTIHRRGRLVPRGNDESGNKEEVEIDEFSMGTRGQAGLPSESVLGNPNRPRDDDPTALMPYAESGGAFLHGDDVRARNMEVVARPGESRDASKGTEGRHASEETEFGQVAEALQTNDCREKGVVNNTNTVLEENVRSPREVETWRTHSGPASKHDPLDDVKPRDVPPSWGGR